MPNTTTPIVWTRASMALALTITTLEGRKLIEESILALYERQTASEQSTLSTNESNGRGFNANDATLLSSFAIWIRNSRVNGPGARLTSRQFTWAERKIMKYSAQLAGIFNQRGIDQCEGSTGTGLSAVRSQVFSRAREALAGRQREAAHAEALQEYVQRERTAAPRMRRCPECHGSGRVEVNILTNYAEEDCPNGCASDRRAYV